MEKVDYAVEIPNLGSMILTHTWEGEIKGLKAWPRQERPPASIVFYSFRVMLVVGFAMAALGLWSAWRRVRRDLYGSRNLYRAALLMTPSGFLAVLAGWITTEVGRQPYTVYGLLLTADSISPLEAPAVGGSLIAFIAVYFVVFTAGIFYILRLMGEDPNKAVAAIDIGPSRAAGIAPGPALAKRRRPAGSA
jgi:cytochrome d ubiquinol oxidase subunit I